MTKYNLNNLDRAIINQLGYDASDLECSDPSESELMQTLIDISNHGAQGGVSGFIYYSELQEFYGNNSAAIVSLIEDRADDYGQDPIAMVKGFNCLNSDYTSKDIAIALYGDRLDADNMIVSALCWFSLEDLAYRLADY